MTHEFIFPLRSILERAIDFSLTVANPNGRRATALLFRQIISRSNHENTERDLYKCRAEMILYMALLVGSTCYLFHGNYGLRMDPDYLKSATLDGRKTTWAISVYLLTVSIKTMAVLFLLSMARTSRRKCQMMEDFKIDIPMFQQNILRSVFTKKVKYDGSWI